MFLTLVVWDFSTRVILIILQSSSQAAGNSAPLIGLKEEASRAVFVAKIQPFGAGWGFWGRGEE